MKKLRKVWTFQLAMCVMVVRAAVPAGALQAEPKMAEETGEQRIIPNFPLLYQMPELPTGCEVTALTMVMRFYGCEVGKVAMASQYLPVADPDFWTGSDGRLYGPDAEKYFVGSPFSEEGMVCGTTAICTAANRYFKEAKANLTAKAMTGAAPRQLYRLVDQGTPVAVWVTIGMADRVNSMVWHTADGRRMTMDYNDHGAVLIGYSPTTVTLADPISGRVTYSRAQFERVFRSRGGQCVWLEKTEPYKTTGYRDVPDDAWFAGAVAFCREKGLMDGVGDLCFDPEETMSRGMLAAVLYRMEGKPAVSGESPFSDVSGGQWYSAGILWANAQEIAAGYGDGRFGTGDPVTREQAVTFLWRYKGKPQAQAGRAFADEADISAYAVPAVDWASEAGIVQGKGGNRFDPQGYMTRAEVAAVLRNYMGLEQGGPGAAPALSPVPERSPSPEPAASPKAADR